MSIIEKRNTLQSRFITLRQIFHDFQTSVRFSTSSSSADIFANQLKSYEFLGELEEHFIAEKVQYLYQFVHSIFSLIFTMIRQSPNQRNQKPQSCKKSKTIDAGVQTEQSWCEDHHLKAATQNSTIPLTRQKKRAGLQIQIFEKDLTEMSFRQRRRALQKMRDMIYSQDDPLQQPDRLLKDFRPNIEKISYSKSDQSIKAAIDTFKESDISTHIFLKHFIGEFVDIQDFKSSSELLSKDLIQSMSRAITKYKGRKCQGKGRFRIFSHSVEEIIYPTLDQQGYKISVNPMMIQQEEQNQLKPEDSLVIQKNSDVQLLGQQKLSDFKAKSQFKRSRFPSLIGKNNEELNPIIQTKNLESLGSSKSSISSKTGTRNSMRKKLKSQGESSHSLGRSSQKLNAVTNQMPLVRQKNRSLASRNQRSSVRIETLQKENNQLILSEKQKVKEKQHQKSKKLRKRYISNFLDRVQNRQQRNSQQVRIK